MITPGLSLIWSQLSKPVTTVGRQCSLTVYSLPCVSAEMLKQLDFLCIPEQQFPTLASIWASHSINSSEKGSNVRLSHNSIKPGHQKRLIGNHVYINVLSPKTTLKEQTPLNFSFSSLVMEAAFLQEHEQKDNFTLHWFWSYKECIQWGNILFSLPTEWNKMNENVW